MFNSKKESLTRKTVAVTTDDYGDKVETYTQAANINMFISLSTEEITQSNDMRIQQCSHIGLTQDTVTVGDKIADKYIVQFINQAGREKICYLKEIESNGSYN